MDSTFTTHVTEAIQKFYTLYENDETLNTREALMSFLDTMNFRFEDETLTNEILVDALLNKTFHEKFMTERLLNKEIFPFWKTFVESDTSKVTNSKVSLSVGSEIPEIKKTHLNLEFVSDTNKQKDILNSHLSILNPDVEIPFAAVKLYTSNPSQIKEFLEMILQMVQPMIESLPIPVKPEISVVEGNDHVVIHVTAKKSLEMNFIMIVFGHLCSKLPEYDVELRLNLQTGTNFRHLIDNHTDNTIFDLLNGFKISVEFKNNLAGFVDKLVSYLPQIGKDHQTKFWRIISFVLGSLTLTTDVNLNLGANELALMANLPPVNIFDKQGLLSAAPLDQAKALREDEMGQMILPNMGLLEGKADVFLSTPFFTLRADLDVSGILDLLNKTIDTFTG